MIEITYKNGIVDIFEIYSETDNHIVWKDYAQNFIRINKRTNKISLLHENEWTSYDKYVDSYRIL